MAKTHKAKPLSKIEINDLCDYYRRKDFTYAAATDECIEAFFARKPRVKNWSELKTAVEMERVFLGLHTQSMVVEVIDHTAEIEAAEIEAAERLGKIK